MSLGSSVAWIAMPCSANSVLPRCHEHVSTQCPRSASWSKRRWYYGISEHRAAAFVMTGKDWLLQFAICCKQAAPHKLLKTDSPPVSCLSFPPLQTVGIQNKLSYQRATFHLWFHRPLAAQCVILLLPKQASWSPFKILLGVATGGDR